MPSSLEEHIEPAALVLHIAEQSAAQQLAAESDESVYAMPATQGQVRFWSLDQLNSGNPALNMPLMWQCSGPLDVSALQRAFAQTVFRHESLRTTFSLIAGQVMQVIHPAAEPSLPVSDLTALHGENQRLEADRLTRRHAELRMDLRAGPLLELRLMRLNAQHHVLLITMHHIICDGVSNGVLMRDVMAFYEAALTGSEARLPELTIQFADYAVWNEDWRSSPEHETGLQFWRDSLGNDFSPLRLPHDGDALDHLPAHRTDSTGAIETLLVPSDLTARSHAFCAREGVTLNVLLFSVFCALVNRLTGQNDLSIGSPCANRSDETEDLIGMFMNIQVLRVRLDKQSTFRNLLQQVHRWTVSASEYQALPFEDLVHDPFFSSGTGTFEVPIFFLYQKSFMLPWHVAGPHGDLRVVPLRSESPGAIFEIMFAIVDREEGPRLQLEYNPRFFKVATMQRYLRDFLTILEMVLATPALAVCELPVETIASSTGPRPELSDASAARAAELDREYVAPRDDLERQLADLWQRTLRIPRISIRASFFSLGVSSLAALRLVTKINTLYVLDLGLASLISASSIESIADLIRNHFSAKTTSTIVPLKSTGSEPPLFIVHGVGGNVINFYGLALRLGPDRPVYGIQSQALLAGQPAYLRLEDMAAYYIREMQSVQPTGPYHLLGYSFGGTLALEMTRQLGAAGEQVALLGMLDSGTLDFEAQRFNALSVAEKLDRRLRRLEGNTVDLDWSDRLKYLVDKTGTRAVRFAAQAANAAGIRSLPSSFKSAWDINHVALERYKLRPFDGKLVLFRASQQEFPGGERDLGWGNIFQRGVEIHEIEGDHERIFMEPNIDALAAELQQCLKRV